MEVCDLLLDEYVNLNPTLNDFFMEEKWSKKRHVQPNIYSEDYYRKQLLIDKKFLRILENKETLTYYDRIIKDDLFRSVHYEEDYQIYMYMPINSLNNILIDYVNECSGNGYYTFKTNRDYTDFMKRLQSLKGITNEIIDKMKRGIRKKVTLYSGTVDLMIHTMNDIIKNKTYKHQKKASLTSKLNKAIDQNLVIQLKRLNEFLMNEYYEHCSQTMGLCSYSGGKKYYRSLVKDIAFNNSTPEQVHRLGHEELKRLLKIKKKIEKDIGVKDIDSHIKLNPKLYYQNKKDILDDLHKIRDRTIKDTQELFHMKLNKRQYYKIKEVPQSLGNHFAFYTPSDLKRKNVGTFYMNVSRPEKINKKELYVLAIHEGIPGHHYENEYQNMSKIPKYFKIALYPPYSEGWGLYCEGLGNYKDKYEHYFKNQYDIQRTLRLIIDTGIHYYGWSYTKCYETMKQYLQMDDMMIRNELLRYNDSPGQALSYKIGEKVIMDLRNRCVEKGISIQDFHTYILEMGPCPLKELVYHFDKWILS
uniref:DUF885 domain-containing protein n=1 Tax=viral metagenome TaxID=1070528 RepID=A0A6C0L1I9_9ZZZZ|tara:strand:+ start:5265 stop:6854 length:1590 start_codon:yes stop_codon:yes gene_type:complete